jgi:hypothetical protein
MVSVTENAENQYIVGGRSGGQQYGNSKFLEWLGNYTKAFQYPDDDIKEIFENQTSKNGIYEVLSGYIRKSTERDLSYNKDTGFIKG